MELRATVSNILTLWPICGFLEMISFSCGTLVIHHKLIDCGSLLLGISKPVRLGNSTVVTDVCKSFLILNPQLASQLFSASE